MSNPNWTKDELILALDLYFDIDFTHNQSDKNPKIKELSKLLNSLPIHDAHLRGKDFRNQTGVYMKLSNFLRFDPNYQGKGLSAGAKMDGVVWNEFASDLPKLRRTAELIRQSHETLSQNQTDFFADEDDEEFPEGKILTRLHKQRERKKGLPKKKKAKVLRETGKLACEVCGFDFNEVYGELGHGFAECHHTIPLSLLKPDSRTKLSDLAIVCANCHRMLHRSREWFSVDDLKKLLRFKK